MKAPNFLFLLIPILVILFSESISNSLYAQDFKLPQDPLEGQALFAEKSCIKCHSILGQGGRIGSDLGRSQANKTALDILAAMWNHSGEMSQAMVKGQTIPKLEPAELAAMLSFLYYLTYFGKPGSSEAGASLIESRGCLNCHSIRGSGGAEGPALDHLGRSPSPVLIAQQMWNHGPKMIQLLQKKNISFPALQGKDIADLVAYLHSVNPEASQSLTYAFPGSSARGAEVFTAKGCNQCHSLNGRGGSIGPDLGRRSFHYSVEEIAAMMWNHAPKMFQKMQAKAISIPKFKNNEMADLIAYLYFLDFRIQPGDADKGRIIFEEKNCHKCHSLNGYKATVGPNLARIKGLDDIITISTAMWNHNILMQKEMKKQQIPYPRFNGEELKNLLTFIQSIRERAHEGK